MKSNFFKTFLFALIGFIISIINQSENIDMVFVAISSVGFILLYLAQHFVLPSTSGLGGYNWWDFVKGLLVALSAFISNYAASYVTGSALDWAFIWKGVLGVFVIHMLQTLGFDVNGNFLKKVNL